MKILCLCDSPTLNSGFSRVATNLIQRWARMGATVDVWGIAFMGWGYKQHPYVNAFFPAGTGHPNDHWAGQQRLEMFLTHLQQSDYTHLWIMQDTFQLVNFGFPKVLRKICAEKGIRSMMYFPVDAPLDPAWTDILAAVDVPVAYTHYGRAMAQVALAARKTQIARLVQAAAAEPDGPRKEEMTAQAQAAVEEVEGLNAAPVVEVLPHGVDTTVYHPVSERAELRQKFWSTEFAKPDDFLMVNVNVNQRRKDVARSLEILKAVRALGVPAKLMMHMTAISDDGLNLELVGRQLGLEQNVDWSHHDHLFVRGQGKLAESALVQLYNIADLYLTTTLGEGWGLGITEALACGTAVAIPEHTSCLEIAQELDRLGMVEQCVPLPIERYGLFQGMDNSRGRMRVDVDLAAARIRDYYESGVWRKRAGLTQPVREWLSWDRVAREMMKLMKAESGKQKAESGKPKAEEKAVVL